MPKNSSLEIIALRKEDSKKCCCRPIPEKLLGAVKRNSTIYNYIFLLYPIEEMRKFFLIFFLSVFIVLCSSSKVLAYGIFTSGQTGYDISYPQGTISSLPSSYDFIVIGTTNGRAYTDNPYLGTQTSLANNKTLSLYMNLNAPIGSTVKGNTSTPKPCIKGDKLCQAYNYGYNAAYHSYLYAKQNVATSSMWWLDIETGNSWSSNQAINYNTIQGAIDFFNNVNYPVPNITPATVGIYSSPSMWNSIVGSNTPIQQTTINFAPNWLQSTSCSNTIWKNGQTWLIQTISNPDKDSAC